MSSDLGTTANPSGAATSAAPGVGPWIALILTGVSWFVLDTLRVEWGLIRQGVHFYDMADVIAHPGRVFNGLLIEETDSRLVLRDGTKTETIAKSDIDRHVTQNISMMPEGLEKTMTEQEFSDLVSFLLTREPPRKD